MGMDAMPQAPTTATPPREGRVEGASGFELAAVAFGLVAIVALQLWATGSWSLLTRPFWLDEMYTHALVADPSARHALAALADGVETHPPALYVLQRAYTRLVGSTDEAALRSFGMLTMLLALVGLYACLRETFARVACLAAVLAAWSHPLVVNQAFNARFYGLWLAAVTWLAFALVRARRPRLRPVAAVAIAVCAVLGCTVHYFGVISLALVTVGEALARRQAGMRALKGLWPVAAGPMALAACLPMLHTQRAMTVVPTWMEPLDADGALALLRSLVEPFPFAWLILAAWLSVLLGQSAAGAGRALSPLGGPTALLVMPLVVLGISWAGPPAYEARYTFPTFAGLAAAGAWLCARCSRPAALTLSVWLLVLGGVAVEQNAQSWKAWTASMTRLMTGLQEQTDQAPILFESAVQLYVVDRYAAPEVRSRCRLLDFRLSEIGNTPSNRVFMRDLGRRYATYYPRPPLMPWTEVRTLPRFFLVAGRFAGGAPGVEDGFYPGFRVRPVAPDLYELTSVRQAPRPL